MSFSERRRHHAISVLQASAEAPTLAKLTHMLDESNQRLMSIHTLLPPGMRSTVKAGPIDEKGWCLLVESNAAAAKLRQLLPALQSHLQHEGWPPCIIRVRLLGN